MLITEPWHTTISPTNPSIFAVNNPHGMPDPLPDAYAQTLNFTPAGSLQIMTDIPMELFDPAKVRTYPQAYEGVKDKELPGRADILPARVSALSQLMTFFSVNMMLGVEAQFNFAAEIFIHSSAEPRNEQGPNDTRLYEIMYWTHKPTSPIIGLGEVLLDHETFELRYKPGNRAYVAFMLKTPPSNTELVYIDWLQLLAIVNTVAAETGLIDPIPDGYITSVELGSEGWAGSQTVEVRDFKNQIAVGVPADVGDPDPVPGEAVPLYGLITRLQTECSCLASYLESQLQWPNANGGVVSRLMIKDLRRTLDDLEAEHERNLEP